MTLPLIDVEALRAARTADDGAVRSLRAACADTGFFYIERTGVVETLRRDMFEYARAFFAQPDEAKLSLDLADSPCRHGYEPLKRQTLEAGAAADLKEGFYIGREAFGPNRWPLGLTGFRETMERYQNEIATLAGELMRGLALSLHLAPDAFTSFCHDPLARLRLLHYPPQPATAADNERGAGAHTDYGGITILLQDDAGGLQVFHQGRQAWIDAPPIADTFVVNLGDMIARWTNDRYRSTLHRVINLSGGDRYSIPFFFHGNVDEIVACIPTCLEAGEWPRYEPVTVAEHFIERMDSSYRKHTATEMAR